MNKYLIVYVKVRSHISWRAELRRVQVWTLVCNRLTAEPRRVSQRNIEAFHQLPVNCRHIKE